MKRPAFILLCTALLAGCAVGPNPAPATLLGPADVPRISAQELQKRLQAGEAVVVVDVRPATSYAQEHIAGAISMPEEEVAERAGELPQGNLIVFYCT